MRKKTHKNRRKTAEGAKINLIDYTHGLSTCQNGIWHTRDIEPIFYPEQGNNNYFEIEETSFWFRHRSDCIEAAVKKFPPKNGGPLFDIGGGNGFVARGLINKGFQVVLVEPGSQGAKNAKTRGVEHVICGSALSAAFKMNSLPAIGLFDVLEHVKDELNFLKELYSSLSPGGILYGTVPAFQFLWSHDDIRAGHFRRYSLKKIKKVLIECGFKTLFETYIFSLLPLPIFLFRTLPYCFGIDKRWGQVETVKRDHAKTGVLLGKILLRCLHPELEKIRKSKSLYFGGSCLVVAMKQEN